MDSYSVLSHTSLAGRSVVLVAAWAGLTSAVTAQPTPFCNAPVLQSTALPTGSGDSTSLSWDAPANANSFRVWAQWRVPEGEAIKTLDLVVSSKNTVLPPSPMRWRPLKLVAEVQSICADGGESAPMRFSQLQFDAVAQENCPAVQALTLDATGTRLTWRGTAQDRVSFSFHQPKTGTALARMDTLGASMAWPNQLPKPAVIRALRLCGEERRSRLTYVLVK